MSGKAEQTVEIFARVCSKIDNGAFGLPSVKTLINWLTTYGYWAALAAFVIGAILWALGNKLGHSSASGGGKGMIMGGAVCVLLVTFAPALVNSLTEVGRQSGRC